MTRNFAIVNKSSVSHSSHVLQNCTRSCIFGRPFAKRFALCYRTAICPVGDVGVLWPNGL